MHMYRSTPNRYVYIKGLITLALFGEREKVSVIKLLGMLGLGFNRGDGMV